MPASGWMISCTVQPAPLPLALRSVHSTAPVPSGTSSVNAVETPIGVQLARRRHHVDHLLGRRAAQLVLGLEAAQHALDLRPQLGGLVTELDRQLERPRLRLEALDDPERETDEQRADNRQPVEPDARAEADRQRAQHHHGVLRVLDLRPIADQVRRADDAKGSGQAGADDQHDERADDGKDDLRLDDGGLAHRCAAAARPQAPARRRAPLRAAGARRPPTAPPAGCRRCLARRPAAARSPGSVAPPRPRDATGTSHSTAVTATTRSPYAEAAAAHGFTCEVCARASPSASFASRWVRYRAASASG